MEEKGEDIREKREDKVEEWRRTREWREEKEGKDKGVEGKGEEIREKREKDKVEE